MRLADKYDAAQERGEVRTRADNQHASSKAEEAVGVSDIGLTHKAIHEARQIRDAEEADPGVIKRPLATPQLGARRRRARGAHHRKPHEDTLRSCAKKLMQPKPFKLVVAALANKMARIAFAIMRGKTSYSAVPA